jgi:hypothetical protein
MMIQDTINSEDLIGPRALVHPHGDVEARAATTTSKNGKGVLAFVYPNKVACKFC